MTELPNQPEKNRREYFATYREQNAQEIRKYNNDYYLNNRESIRQRQNAYYKRKRDVNVNDDTKSVIVSNL
jgi:hypothetical protein